MILRYEDGKEERKEKERDRERWGECRSLEVCSKLIILFISLNILPGSARSPDANN